MGTGKNKRSDSELSSNDATQLDWYLGVGACAFEKSPMGSMLERSWLLSEVSERCSQCNGQGIIDADHVPKDPKCKKCSGGCEYCVNGKVVEGCWCSKCRGTGFNNVRIKNDRQQTVKLKKSAGREPGYTPEDWALTTYAIVSRYLNRLEGVSRESYQVLVAYHGDKGSRWSDTEQGRIFAVLPMTKAGKRLLKLAQTRAGADLGLTAAEQLATVLGAKGGLNGEQLKLAAEAREEAWSKYAKACKLWNKVKGDAK